MSGLSLKPETAATFAPVSIVPEGSNHRGPSPSPSRHRRCLRRPNRPVRQDRSPSDAMARLRSGWRTGASSRWTKVLSRERSRALLAVVDGGRS